MELKLKLTAVVGVVAVLAVALAAETAAYQQVNAACTGDPHDRDAPTGNPRDSGGRRGEGDNCHGAQ